MKCWTPSFAGTSKRIRKKPIGRRLDWTGKRSKKSWRLWIAASTSAASHRRASRSRTGHWERIGGCRSRIAIAATERVACTPGCRRDDDVAGNETEIKSVQHLTRKETALP